MFTGIIETTSKIRSTRPAPGGMILTIDIKHLAEDTKLGDSIAVNGTCLTVTKLTGSTADFDVSAETLSKSNLASARPSTPVNLERAMQANSRFGGHIVQGHVDGTAKIKTITPKGSFTEITIAASTELLDEMIPKGSVSINGISLTIARMDKSTFTIALIPKTITDTTLSTAKQGDTVNIETDIIAKTIKKQLQNILPNQNKLTAEKLKQLGF